MTSEEGYMRDSDSGGIQSSASREKLQRIDPSSHSIYGNTQPFFDLLTGACFVVQQRSKVVNTAKSEQEDSAWLFIWFWLDAWWNPSLWNLCVPVNSAHGYVAVNSRDLTNPKIREWSEGLAFVPVFVAAIKKQAPRLLPKVVRKHCSRPPFTDMTLLIKVKKQFH